MCDWFIDFYSIYLKSCMKDKLSCLISLLIFIVTISMAENTKKYYNDIVCLLNPFTCVI